MQLSQVLEQLSMMENKIFILIGIVCAVNQSYSLDWNPNIQMHCEDGRFCVTDVNSSSCPETTVLMPRSSVDNCCPGCVPLNEGFDCEPDDTVCGPGLSCTVQTCKKNKKLCPFYGNGVPTITVKPTCDEEGKYAAVQCKGEKSTGRCFCYNSDGYRLFGQQWWKQAQNMTCACSRRTDELQKEGRTNVTLHCNEEGNYEELQCDSNICWCAEEKTGHPASTVVPITMMSLLPCYDAESVGSQYLRKCESVVIATNTIEEEMSAHGTMYGQRPFINCELDGSYGSYQADKISVFCTWKDSTKLGSWQAELSALSTINCNCARDTRYFQNAGKELTLNCNGSGDYVSLQPQDKMVFCVDPDGATVSGLLVPSSKLTCDGSYYISLPKQ